ncbi:E3 ubiquitin protein ligase DRIP2-like [Musa acuminata AAA Group]|uniref:E3 ubiquitin protein ligase DRIP2-like n=1 Tax=Musa acuminata AAA Group TaxID=214697 RepID=UPI0031E16DD7
MVRAGDLLRQHEEFSGVLVAVSACFDNTRSSPPSKLSSMAEEPSGAMAPEAEEEEEEGRDEGDVPGSSSREWLQLGLGNPPPPPHVRRQRVPKELELFRDRPSSSSPSVAATQHTTTMTTMPEAGTGIRVVVPARQAGVWLALEAAADQGGGGGGEALLPQIPRNYLRIKDGSLTIRLLMKYLMNKLGLEDESEVEITCRDQVMLPLWTLEYVRDNIWFSGDVAPMILPDTPSINHLMTLHYRRGKKDGQVHEPPCR